MRVYFHTLSEDDQIEASRLALIANRKLASGTPLHELSDDELRGYITMRELDLSLACSEMQLRLAGVESTDRPPVIMLGGDDTGTLQ